jgi:hypothetical protein
MSDLASILKVMTTSPPAPDTPEAAPPRFHAEPLASAATYRFPADEAALLPWSHAETRLAAARHYWLATTRPDGPPHVTPLLGAWLDGRLYLDGFPGTRWARNLDADPRAAIHLPDPSDVVVLEGAIAGTKPDDALRDLLNAAWEEKYDHPLLGPDTDAVRCFTPDRGRGWSTTSLRDGTRWVRRG